MDSTDSTVSNFSKEVSRDLMVASDSSENKSELGV